MVVENTLIYQGWSDMFNSKPWTKLEESGSINHHMISHQFQDEGK
jgi:hypothetical protein